MNKKRGSEMCCTGHMRERGVRGTESLNSFSNKEVWKMENGILDCVETDGIKRGRR
jgi:hypothetical protein